MRTVVLFALLSLAFSLRASRAQSGADALSNLQQNIKEICTQPATAGSHWSVIEGDNGSVNLRMAGGSMPGSYKFSYEEWSGIQTVLQKDQASDNASYHECVEELAKIFSRVMPATARNQTEIDRRLRGFLLSHHLFLPGATISDDDLTSEYSVTLMPRPLSLGYSVLNGDFRGLSQIINSPVGSFSKFVIEKDGAVVGVMLTVSCSGNVPQPCASNYQEWRSSIEQIEGDLHDSDLQLGGGPPGSPFSDKGVIKSSTAYDANWRVYVDRLDMENRPGPQEITLIVASNNQ